MVAANVRKLFLTIIHRLSLNIMVVLRSNPTWRRSYQACSSPNFAVYALSNLSTELAKEWTVGCVNPASRLALAAWEGGHNLGPGLFPSPVYTCNVVVAETVLHSVLT